MRLRQLKRACLPLCACLMAMVPWLDLAVARKARPDAVDLFGYLYQLIARTFASLAADRLAAALLAAVCLWLCARYLFHKPKDTGVGEYLLCGFLSVMQMLCTAVRTQDTVRVLWENPFQLAKAALFLAGMFLLLLMLLRALKELLEKQRQASLPSSPSGLRGYKSFWKPFWIIGAAWLPQILIRYPGVLMWDSYMQIKQFTGEAQRLSSHPPFGTLFYGTLAWLGEMLGSRNLIYFVFTLVQCACYIAVLAYSLQVMYRLRVPERVRRLALWLYALSPVYVGWATVIAKDTMFQIPFLWMVVLLMECVGDREAFFGDWRKPASLGVCFLIMTLSRHNGAPLAIAVMLALMCVLPGKGRRAHAAARTLICAAVSLALAFGVNAAITRAMDIRDPYMQDTLSLPFQQTARVVKLHGDEIPPEEVEVINRVLDYGSLAERYEVDYADNVKDTYRQSATREDRLAYWTVWLRQLVRWPADYLDAALHMNGVLFDLRDNAPMYICFSDMELDTYVYPWSFNDMTMYDREPLVPLSSMQRALTEWYMDADKIPLAGLFATMSFATVMMLALLYLSVVGGRGRAALVWLPGMITLVICMFSPVAYLRYALPLVGMLPLGLAGYYVICGEEQTA